MMKNGSVSERVIYCSNIKTLRSANLDRFERVYFGNEFCDELIPTKDMLVEACAYAKDNDKPFTFVTCYVSEFNFNKYNELFEYLSSYSADTEIVVNEFGLFTLCERYQLKPVLGRVLVRQKRDPRISEFIASMPSVAGKRLRQAALNKYMIDVLRQKGVERIELDNVFQRIDIEELEATNMRFSIYVPYGYVSITRMCLFRQKSRVNGKQISFQPCSIECINNLKELYNKKLKYPLYMKGNALFFKNESEDVVNKGSVIDRIVYQPEIPN